MRGGRGRGRGSGVDDASLGGGGGDEVGGGAELGPEVPPVLGRQGQHGQEQAVVGDVLFVGREKLIKFD